jgi:hypothetical protein
MQPNGRFLEKLFSRGYSEAQGPSLAQEGMFSYRSVVPD